MSTYNEELGVGNGQTFDDALELLRGGRCLQLDVWHATCRGPCLSGSGEYGHDLAVAPEQSGDRWLVNDPWCSPASWQWWAEDLLRAGAEQFGSMSYTAATSGPPARGERELRRFMAREARRLFGLYFPGREAPIRPPDTGGSSGRILFTYTAAHGDREELDMPINSAEGLASALVADVPQGLDFYRDPNLADRLGSMSKPATVPFIGNPIGETVAGGARAIQVVTATAYGDGSSRPTIVYVAAGAIAPYRKPSVPPADPDVDEAIAERDDEWRAWLLEGAPGSEP
jgi:hypothetical protein